ncbi:conserved hypothetical protein [Candida tropicalis MYA-3404]|uniref:EKC/KEOPS complex subunit CGI121 n=1 Tax=Candida tropicalis (strain ATCC MYA-3404 / T1) TaxID=294747 RepID=C5MGS5_CANTT|nr:conserved hypothetical protein [Candida tropicalis MYA-3404]EER30827.1 conserved hypothetical protein [Candida tropicalis MYA-3404]KAG4404385.1 hypothetical protein JTP64_006137 [Candida tropicalis]MCP8716324.1 EKC/KEOPS complex subunit CGI121/TPRKB [Asgard group archaeon]
MSLITFPQFPEYKVYISLYTNINPENISTIKSNLIAANSKYDYCFLNTKYIISKEHLLQSIHKSLLNYKNNCMTSKNLNSEIILNLSPLNNIGDALKKFGISEDCPNSIIVKIIKDDESNDFDLNEIINGNVVDITDEYIFDQLVDLPKFRKLYKLNDAKLDKDGDVQGQLTRLAIGACILRGC